MFKSLIKRITVIESVRAFLEQWGFWGWGVAVLPLAFGLLYAGGAWFFSAVPVWLLPLLTLGVVALGVFIFYYILKIRQWRRAHTVDLPKLGDRMIDFASRLSRDIRDYEIQRPLPPMLPVDWTDEDRISFRANQMKQDSMFRAWLVEKFGGEVRYFFNETHRLDIYVPTDVFWNVVQMPAFFDYAGRMLKENRLEELKTHDPDLEFRISGIYR